MQATMQYRIVLALPLALLALGASVAQAEECPPPSIVVAGHPRLEILHLTGHNNIAIPFSNSNFAGLVTFVGYPTHDVPPIKIAFHVRPGQSRTVHVSVSRRTARSLRQHHVNLIAATETLRSGCGSKATQHDAISVHV